MTARHGLDPGFIARFEKHWREQPWRLANLYFIKPKGGGEPIPFRPNPIQKLFYKQAWRRNVVLKARGIGMTTCISAWMLDCCYTKSNFSCALVAHTEDKAKEIFQDNVLFMHEHMPYSDIRRDIKPGKLGSQSELVFDNNSRFAVYVTLLGGTYQALHSTELGYISEIWPEKAVEFKSAGLPAARDEDAYVFIESTARGGPRGVFYETCMTAREETNLILAGKIRRGPRSYRFHFFPWFLDPSKKRGESYPIAKEDAEYFTMLERAHGIKLTDEQKWWYCETANGPEGLAKIGMMKCNYPSTVEEAFESFVRGAYFTEALNRAAQEGRIGTFRYDPMYPIYTWWDIGWDGTAIWFTQTVGNRVHVIWYYENSQKDMLFYLDYLKGALVRLPWPPHRYAEHVGPHDIASRRLMTDVTQSDLAARFGVNFRATPRPDRKQLAIQAAMLFMHRCCFDKENCALGLQRLQNYRPMWDVAADAPKDKPIHDPNSHAADAFQVLAMNHDRVLMESWRAAAPPTPVPQSVSIF